jgi:glycosyltransferase involved in cell wall biosynthesis
VRTHPLRVLVFDQARGVWGAQQYLLRLAPLLRDVGIELTLCCPRDIELHDAWRSSGFALEALALPTARTIRVDGRPSPARLAREGVGLIGVARSIAAIARRGNFDVLWSNAHWVHLDVGIASRLVGIPAVLHLHEEAVPGLGTSLRAVCVRLAAHTVAVSKQVAEGLPSSVRDRVSVVPNGVDTTEFAPADERNSVAVGRIREDFGFADDDVMVLASTRLDPVKRIEDLTSAIVGVNDARVRLVIAGTTSGFPEYQRSVIDDARRRAGGAVTFCGWRDDVVDLLRACDVCLHAGVVEGMPLGLLEAQACGVPVVAYAAAGVPEAVIDGTTALLAPPGDVGALTHALRRLALDDSLRSQFASAARANAVAEHGIERQADRIAEVITTVARRAQR